MLDGRTLDPAWTEALEGADAVIHLSGRSVNCRYNAENRREIIDSRVVPTLLIGKAIEQAAKLPPEVWMNASTSTFYRHALDRPQDEFTGELGGSEPGAPDTWNFSIDVARRWEEAFYSSNAAGDAQGCAEVVDDDEPGSGWGVFGFVGAGEGGLGGTEGSGRAVRLVDTRSGYCRAVDFLLERCISPAR